MSRKNIVVLVLFAVIILSTKIYNLYREHSVNYSLVFTYDNVELYGGWQIVSDNGYYATEAFSNRHEKQIGSMLPPIFDEVGHTYILCYGYNLEKLFYREIDRNGQAGDKHSFYNAQAVLRPADSQLVYVYLIEDSVNLDRDIHSNDGKDTTILRATRSMNLSKAA